MPTYEYICQKCATQFDHFQSMKEDALSICPEAICPSKKWGKGKVKRVIGSGAGLLFKGSGFYLTDYRSEGYKAAAKKESESSQPSKSKSKSPDTKSKSPNTKPIQNR